MVNEWVAVSPRHLGESLAEILDRFCRDYRHGKSKTVRSCKRKIRTAYNRAARVEPQVRYQEICLSFTPAAINCSCMEILVS